MVKLERLPDSEGERAELIKIEIRKHYTTIIISDVAKPFRKELIRDIIRAYLRKLGMEVIPPKEKYQHMIAVDPVTKREVPIRTQGISVYKHGWEIRVDNLPLSKFVGFYLCVYERAAAEDVILQIESGELRKLLHGRGKIDPGRTRGGHVDYRHVDVPKSLVGFSRYLSSDRLKEAVFGERKGN